MNQSSKFALGGGGFCIYAPRYPRYQYSPGFSDEVSVFNAEVRPLFHLAVVDGKIPVRLECEKVVFEDNTVTLGYVHPLGGLRMEERRFVSTDDRFVSEVKLFNEGKEDRDLTFVLWTVTDSEGEAPSLEGDSFRIKRQLSSHDFPPVPAEIVFASPDSKGARCLQGFFCEGGSDRPDFEETPWFDTEGWPTPRAKKPMVKPSPIVPASRVYLGLFRTTSVRAGGSVAHRFEANVILKGKGINYRPRRPDPKDENGYLAFMEDAPVFHSEWKALERLVQHRLDMLHLLRVPGGVGHMVAPNACEGTGFFHEPIAFSAPAIMRDARWLGDPSLARGIIRGFFENVRQSGMVPGRLYLTGVAKEFYHADWGGGFEALDDVHGDRNTKRAVIQHAQRFVKWLANNRDPEGSGLTDIVNHFEAGQEFSRRYTVIDDKADRAEEFEEQFRLKGVDVSVFRYKLVSFLERVADELQEKAMANRFIAEKEIVREVIRKRMWDDKAGIFMDIDPKSRRRTGVKAAVGFYPLGTDIATPAQVDKMLSTLGSRKEFWTPYPVPSLSVSDPWFDADGRWKETRRDCPWNGRVWPMVNSQIMEALTYASERGNKKARKLLGELFKKTVEMMSGELENLDEPRSFEHYSPTTGLPSRYRGFDHCLHSFVLDNVFRVGCGFAVRFGEVKDELVADGMPDFKVSNIPVGSKRFTVERKGSRFKVTPQ